LILCPVLASDDDNFPLRTGVAVHHLNSLRLKTILTMQLARLSPATDPSALSSAFLRANFTWIYLCSERLLGGGRPCSTSPYFSAPDCLWHVSMLHPSFFPPPSFPRWYRKHQAWSKILVPFGLCFPPTRNFLIPKKQFVVCQVLEVFFFCGFTNWISARTDDTLLFSLLACPSTLLSSR